MSEVTELEFVKNLLQAEDDALGGDFLYELHYESPGNTVEFEHAELPEWWTVKVVEINDEFNYESYGYKSADDAYVILSVSDGNLENLYKIPGTYASFEGWNWDLSALTKVEKRKKIVTDWEWVTVN